MAALQAMSCGITPGHRRLHVGHDGRHIEGLDEAPVGRGHSTGPAKALGVVTGFTKSLLQTYRVRASPPCWGCEPSRSASMWGALGASVSLSLQLVIPIASAGRQVVCMVGCTSSSRGPASHRPSAQFGGGLLLAWPLTPSPYNGTG